MDFTNTSDTGIRSVICVGASTRLGGGKEGLAAQHMDKRIFNGLLFLGE